MLWGTALKMSALWTSLQSIPLPHAARRLLHRNEKKLDPDELLRMFKEATFFIYSQDFHTRDGRLSADRISWSGPEGVPVMQSYEN
jgi:hypothetical protein